MLQEPIFLNDFNPAKFYPDRIFQFLDYIIQQGPINARRRNEYFLQFNRANANRWFGLFSALKT